MPIDAKTLFCAVVLPAIIAIIALWADARLARRRAPASPARGGADAGTLEPASDLALPVLEYSVPTSRRWDGLVGLACATAFCVAMPCVVGRSPLEMRTGWHVLFWVAAGLGGLSVAFGSDGLRLRGIVFAIAPFAAAWALSGKLFAPARGYGAGAQVLNVVLGALPMAMAPIALRVVQHRRGAIAAAWTLAATAGLSAVAVGFLGKSATLSQLALAPAAMAAVAAAFVTFYRYTELPLSAWATLAILTQSIVLVSLDAWYGYMPILDGVALMLAPVAGLAALWGVTERRYATALIAVVAVLACCSVPIVHIIKTAMAYGDAGYL